MYLNVGGWTENVKGGIELKKGVESGEGEEWAEKEKEPVSQIEKT